MPLIKEAIAIAPTPCYVCEGAPYSNPEVLLGGSIRWISFRAINNSVQTLTDFFLQTKAHFQSSWVTCLSSTVGGWTTSSYVADTLVPQRIVSGDLAVIGAGLAEGAIVHVGSPYAIRFGAQVVRNGTEHVQNGDFAAAGGWTVVGANIVIGAGVATFTVPPATTDQLLQSAANFSVPVVAGDWYVLSFDWTRTAGSLTVYLGNPSAEPTKELLIVIDSGANGTFMAVAQCGVLPELGFVGDGFSGTLDNVSLTPTGLEELLIQGCGGA